MMRKFIEKNGLGLWVEDYEQMKNAIDGMIANFNTYKNNAILASQNIKTNYVREELAEKAFKQTVFI